MPDDEHDLSERFLALKDWAGGFITGLGVAEVALSKDEREQITDLAKIASIRPDENEQFDGDEEEYLHLFEFARMIPVALFMARWFQQREKLFFRLAGMAGTLYIILLFLVFLTKQ